VIAPPEGEEAPPITVLTDWKSRVVKR